MELVGSKMICHLAPGSSGDKGIIDEEDGFA
jgi:hypothetical protein